MNITAIFVIFGVMIPYFYVDRGLIQVIDDFLSINKYSILLMYVVLFVINFILKVYKINYTQCYVLKCSLRALGILSTSIIVAFSLFIVSFPVAYLYGFKTIPNVFLHPEYIWKIALFFAMIPCAIVAMILGIIFCSILIWANEYNPSPGCSLSKVFTDIKCKIEETYSEFMHDIP